MYLEQIQTVTLSSFLQLSSKLAEELKAWEIHIVSKICKAKFEEKFPILQDKNYVAML
jgi:NifB/MoaA-like Fe-S oxidoreductase